MKTALVQTTYGQVNGLIQKSIEHIDYYAFKGIPYAEPPVGELRFLDPQPPKSWNDVLNATEYGSCCAQYNQITRTYEGSDDCLYLNVYTKSLEPHKKYPVMFYVHGGAFAFGCGDDMFYAPDYLLKKNIVLVTINYRLGILGFLNLEDKIAPGNQGLKDQVMALKWVQSNIINFGGDPNNVTVFGESSGGASVSYLAFSSMSKNLFRRIILQSGVATNPWGSVPNPKKFAYRACEYLGKELRDPKEIIEFLRTIDSLELAKMAENIRTYLDKRQLLYPFGPGVDDKSENPFMAKPILEVASQGLDMPSLIGYNNREGIYSLAVIQDTSVEECNDHFETYIHANFFEVLKEYNLKITDLKRIFNCLNLTSENYCEKIADLLGDMYITYGIQKAISTQVLKSQMPVYMYKFSFDKGMSFSKLMVNTKLSGASHFDELSYIFHMKFCVNAGVKPLQKGSIAYRIMEQMIEMWTNFAINGNPTPITTDLIPVKWTKVSDPKMLNFLNIDHKLTMESTLSVEQRFIDDKIPDNKL